MWVKSILISPNLRGPEVLSVQCFNDLAMENPCEMKNSSHRKITGLAQALLELQFFSSRGVG